MEHGPEGASFSLSPNRGSKASALHVHEAQLPLCPASSLVTQQNWNEILTPDPPLLHFSQRLHFKSPSHALFESAFLF